MGKFRLSVAVGYLLVGIWLSSSGLDRASAQSSSLGFSLKLVQSQPPSSNTPRIDADSSAIEAKSSFFLRPISAACPFPSISISAAAANALIGEVTVEPGEVTSSPAFVPGDGSDADLDMTVSNLIGAGKLDEALQVAQKIQNVSQKNLALRGIVSAYKEAGQLELALQVAKRITESSQLDAPSLDDNISLKDNALSEIARAYVKTGQLEQALQVVEIMGKGFRVGTLLDIAEKYRVAGQLARAASVIDRAVAAYRTMAKPNLSAPMATYFKFLVLSRFTSQYATVGRKEQAVELSSEIFEVAKMLPQQNYMTLTVLSSTAELYASVGQRDKAAEVLSHSLRTAKNIRETFVKALVLAQIGNQYAMLKQPTHATEVLSQALALAEAEKRVSEKSLVLITIARSYGVLGQYDKALQVTNAVEPASLRDQLKQTLVCSREAG